MRIGLDNLILESGRYRGVSVPTLGAEHINREMHGTPDGVMVREYAGSIMTENHVVLDRRQVALLIDWMSRWLK